MKKILLTLFICTSLLGIAQKRSFETTNWINIDKNEYTISYPPDWQEKVAKNNNIEVFLIDSLESKKDKYRESISILKEKLTNPKMDLKKYTDIELAKFEKEFKKSKLVLKALHGTENNQYYQLIHQVKGIKLKLRIIQLVYIKNSTAFVISFKTPKKRYKKHALLGEKILSTFKLK